ncbi:MAG: ABC transporter permease [Eubacteriales bacterium]|nr:ABC transporter permease [Eubacteriales bacterium]
METRFGKIKTKRLRASRPVALILGGILFAAVLLMAIAPSLFTSCDPYEQDLMNMLQPPSAAHIFGTDNYGRDLFARVVYGARVDLVIGFTAMIVPFIVGSLIGLLAGYFGKWVDALIMRIQDIMTAFPFIILVIAIVSILGANISNLYIAIWLVGWRDYTKLVRSEVLIEKNAEYVLAARSLGFSNARVMFRHILPNAINSAVVYAVSDVMLCMLLGASMSFLGLGVQPPVPEWGAIISEGRPYILNAWWICALPGLALAITGTSLSLLGEGVSRLLTNDGRK